MTRVFGVALRSVVRRPARSALASVGVALAIGALVVAEALAERGRDRALAEIREMGATVLIVSARQSRNRGTRATTGAVVTTLRTRDERDIARLVPDIEGVAAEYRGGATVKVGNLARQAVVSGIEPEYAMLRDAPLAQGRFFTAEEDDEGARVVVLGSRLAEAMFSGEPAVDGTLRIRGIPFNVIGVLPPRGTGLDVFDEDEVAFVPLKTARRRLFQVDYLQRIFLRVQPQADLSDVAAATVALLRERHHAAVSEPVDFVVQDQRRLVNLRVVAMRQLGVFQSVVALALILGSALGVLGLELLAIRERRKEIGTRRAVGATRAAVFGQFVLEAAIVTIAGGATGAVSGLVAGRLLATPASGVLAASAGVGCVLAGVVAAAVPAWSAAGRPPGLVLRQS